VSVIDEARLWAAQDPDPETKRELESLIESNDVPALTERFAGVLEFGTAGLRGLLGAGPARMNRVTVSRTTAGLCTWLLGRVPDAASRGVCVGRDARDKSDVFERDVIEVLSGFGIPVWVFSDVVPTPVLAFTVQQCGAAGGVMITASHNPPGYNGYKVYWENGAQIIPPNDRGIAEAIERAPGVDRIRRLPMSKAREKGLIRDAEPSRESYVRSIAGLGTDPRARAPVRVAYTALHGVAEDTFRRVLARAGFEDIQSVPEQAAPDGRFPTVSFPNPEEPGAMDRVLELGSKVGADLAVANDPDGDRVAVAVHASRGFEMLSGNDIGLLLADDLLSRYDQEAQPVVLSTIVSSPVLGRVAAAHGARCEQTLTGHKWIQNRALELEREGLRPVFGYEEALGYAPSSAVRDKDGISSGLLMIDLAARLKARGETLLGARRALAKAHGYVADRQISRRFDEPGAQARMNDAVNRFREDPPSEIGGYRVERIQDFQRRTEWTPAGTAPLSELPSSNLLMFELEGGHRVLLRPSGTEPKLKYYFYAVAPTTQTTDVRAAENDANATLDRLIADLVSPSDW